MHKEEQNITVQFTNDFFELSSRLHLNEIKDGNKFKKKKKRFFMFRTYFSYILTYIKVTNMTP